MKVTKDLKKKFNERNGITLIALVITIIVLLILAGISIMMLTGNNSLVKEALDARERTKENQIKEQIKLAYLSVISKDTGNKRVTARELNEEFRKNNIDAKANKAGKSMKVMLNNENIYLIDENGNISEYEQSQVSKVYVMIYEDGEMVFNSTGNKDNTRNIIYDGSNNDISEVNFIDEGVPYNNYRTQITKVTFEDKIVPRYTARWFLYCSNLTSIENIEFLDTSIVVNMKQMFGACSSLTSLDLSGFDTSNVTDISGMFGVCSSLTSLDLSSFDTSNVTDMSQMFQQAGLKGKLDLSNFNTSNVKTMRSMFSTCNELTEIDLTGFDTTNVTTMYMMFGSAKSFDYNKIKKIYGLNGFNTENVTDMTAMFQRCNQLEELDLSSFNTSNVEVTSNMFSSCASLKKIKGMNALDTSRI